jgi:cobalamin biosynthesis Co2+ chelatase CbiK
MADEKIVFAADAQTQSLPIAYQMVNEVLRAKHGGTIIEAIRKQFPDVDAIESVDAYAELVFRASQMIYRGVKPARRE